MSFTEDLLPTLWLKQVTEKSRDFPDSVVQSLSHSISNISCAAETAVKGCRDETSALVLKIIGIATILSSGVCGVAIPLVGKNHRYLQMDSNLFVVAKAFAAGVILATGFVHMLPDATEALTNPCLPEIPWSKFPFSGFIAMIAALATLLAEFVGTQYYEHKQETQSQSFQVDSVDAVSTSESGSITSESHTSVGKVFGEEEGGAMHIVGMHAHAAHHRHSHGQENGACQGQVREHEHCHSHSHGFADKDEGGSARHIVVSQILELGIVSHSVIIGLSLGVSQSPCTIRTLIVALSFHQFFEGFALGGCISQAQFRALKSTLMAFFFTITTPLGIAVGSGISKFYNPSSPRALVIEGILDSISSGILIYMSLVDLIAADFMSKRMRCNVRLQVMSYFALFLGAGLMASLAAWDA